VNATKADNSPGVLATLRGTPIPVRYLLGGVLINQMGAFVQTFLVLYLTFREFRVVEAGAALTAYSAGAVLGTLLGGELTHRFGPRRTITAAMATSAVILAFVPALSHPSRFVPLLVAVALAGLATQSYRPAAAVMLSDLMPESQRVLSFSMLRIAMNIGAALAPLIAAGLILINWDLLLWLDAATALAYAVLALTLLPETPVPKETEQAGGDRLGYLVVLRDGRFLLFLAGALLAAMIYVQFMVALPLKITAEGHGTSLYSALLICESLVVILCELKVTTYVMRWQPRLACAIGTAVLGLGAAGYGVAGGAIVPLVLTTLVFVAGVMISGPTAFAYPARFPSAVKARYIGAFQATFGLGLALGPTIGVLLWAGLGNGIWPLCGLAGLIGAWCTLVGMRDNARESTVLV
jgi:MFS family permease